MKPLSELEPGLLVMQIQIQAVCRVLHKIWWDVLFFIQAKSRQMYLCRLFYWYRYKNTTESKNAKSLYLLF